MLDRLANWKTALIIFIVAVGIFNLWLFPWRSAKLKNIGVISFFSTVKWSLGVASLTLIAIGLAVWLIKRKSGGGS